MLRSLLLMVGSGILVCPLLPGLDRDEAAHLLRRTGFAPTEAEIAVLLPKTRVEAVTHILDGVRTTPTRSPPAWATVDLGEYYRQQQEEQRRWRDLSEMERNQLRNERHSLWRQQGRELKQWWLNEMVITDSPLTERLTAFWHNHFTTEMRVVEDPVLIYEQHRLIREKAMENFGRLAMAIVADPAMFRYLDSNSNVRGRPNENFAREVMELYTVGEGNYTEEDVTEAARAFTGYRIDPETGRPQRMPRLHDNSVKRVLGHRGPFDGEGIILKLLQKQAEVALQVTKKMWLEFIGPPPTDDKELVKWERKIYDVARVFYADRRYGHYFIRPLLEAVLLHEDFWDPANRGVLIKSPYEFIVGAYRQTQATVDPGKLLEYCARAGQDPFDPPNVKGWAGHEGWINSQSVMYRNEIIGAVVKARRLPRNDPLMAPFTPEHWQLLRPQIWAVAADGNPPANLEAALTHLLYHLK